MANCVRSGSQSMLWHDLIREAEGLSHRQLSEELESYLVFTLMRFTQDGGLTQRVMALDFLDSMALVGKQREQALRDVGDRCLLLAGLFPEQARARRVSVQYFCALGRSAYDELSAQTRAALRQLYAQLAETFQALVRVLIEVRKLSREWRGPDLLTTVELWQATTGPQSELADAFPNAFVVPGVGHG